MDALPPIPTPASQRWREFRIQILPVLVFMLVVGGVVVLWRQAGTGGHLSGVAEGVRSTISSPGLGLLQQVSVQPYQMVQMGDPIAVVLPRDPQVALDLFDSQLAISRLRLQPTVAEQNAMNFEQIRTDLLRMKSELAMAKVNLVRLEADVRRNTPLYKEKLVSEDIYELSVKTRDMFQEEVDTKTRAVAEIERRMEELQMLGVPDRPSSNDLAQVMITQLEAMRDAAATNWGPIILRAPISGMVNSIYRQQGENVAEAEPLVAINAHWADRIVGYLRQPYPVNPEVGMSVQVITRERKAKRFWSHISQVGAQVEIITNSLAFIRQGALVDAGLPVVVEIPKGLQLRPGEAVDILFRARPADAAPALAATPPKQPSASEPPAQLLVE